MPPGMRAYSMDLRERIVAAVDVGATQPEAAARFGVGLRTVERYLARRRSTGSLAVDRQPGGDRAAAPARAEGAAAAAGLAAGPPGCRGRCHAGRARGGGRRRRRPAGVAGIDVAGDRQPAAGTRGRADPGRAPATGGRGVEARSLTATERDETARARWRTRMGGVDPRRLVFVDECGTHPSMPRRRARAARGMRARGAVPRTRGPVTTLLAGVSLAGMSPAMTVQGGTDTAVFAAYLEHFLLPSLAPGTVIVVDNVGAHQPDRIRELITAAGCELVFLPAYSPDLSPIEEAFSKVKTLVQAAAARTRAALDAAIAATGRSHRSRRRRLVHSRR